MLATGPEKKLKLYEDVKKGVVCQNLLEILVTSANDIFEILEKGASSVTVLFLLLLIICLSSLINKKLIRCLIQRFSSHDSETNSSNTHEQELIQKSQYFHNENHDERVQQRRRRGCQEWTVESSGSGRVSHSERGWCIMLFVSVLACNRD